MSIDFVLKPEYSSKKGISSKLVKSYKSYIKTDVLLDMYQEILMVFFEVPLIPCY